MRTVSFGPELADLANLEKIAKAAAAAAQQQQIEQTLAAPSSKPLSTLALTFQTVHSVGASPKSPIASTTPLSIAIPLLSESDTTHPRLCVRHIRTVRQME